MACWRRLLSWPPGNLVVIHPSRRRGQTTDSNGRVHLSQRLPVGLQLADRGQRQPGVVFGVRGGRHDRGQRGLAGGAGQRGGGTVDRAGTRPATPTDRWPAARRECHGCAHAPAGRTALRSAPTRAGGRLRPQQPGHVLDRQHVRAGVDDLLGELQVIVQRVQVLAGIGQITGVAHRDFGYRRACFAHRVDRGTHRLDVVQRVEDAVDVDSGGRRLVDERLRDRAPGTGCSRRCCAPAAASAGRCWAPPPAAQPAAPTGLPSKTEAPHRKSPHPSIRSTTAAVSSWRCRAQPSADRWCATASPAATDARRGTSCR